jgi:hypothetical protein
MIAAPLVAGRNKTAAEDVKAIGAASSKASLSSSKKSQVKRLRDCGVGLHRPKRHGERVAELHRAMDIPGLKH